MDEIKETPSDKLADVQRNPNEASKGSDLLKDAISTVHKLYSTLFAEKKRESKSVESSLPAKSEIEANAGKNLDKIQGKYQGVQGLSNDLKNAFNRIQKILSEIDEKVGILVASEVTFEDPVAILREIEMRVYNINRHLTRPPAEQTKEPLEVVTKVPQTPAADLPAVIRSYDLTEPSSPGLAHEAQFNKLSSAAISGDDFTGPTSAERFSDEPESDSLSPEATLKGALVALYNEAAENRDLRDSLWEKFHITLIENVNAVEQRIGNTLQPEFRQSNDGNFYAVEDTSSGNFLVVPKFDFTIKSINYESTVKFGFICPDFDDNCTYSRFAVLEPALFVKSGDIWRVERQGRLILLG